MAVPLVSWIVPVVSDDGETVGDRRVEFSQRCAECRHLRANLGCAAFRGPIPEPILSGEVDHVEPFPGDGGTTFERRGDNDWDRLSRRASDDAVAP